MSEAALRLHDSPRVEAACCRHLLADELALQPMLLLIDLYGNPQGFYKHQNEFFGGSDDFCDLAHREA
jgi:hypothetical protein